MSGDAQYPLRQWSLWRAERLHRWYQCDVSISKGCIANNPSDLVHRGLWAIVSVNNWINQAEVRLKRKYVIMFKQYLLFVGLVFAMSLFIGCTEDDVVPFESDASVDLGIITPSDVAVADAVIVDAVVVDAVVVDAVVVDAVVVDAVVVDAALMDKNTCETCDFDGDCQAGQYCVGSADGSIQTCLPGCGEATSECPRGFECEDIQRDLTPAVAVCVPQDTVCCVDEDGDGYGQGMDCTGSDCADGNEDSNPGAVELCNGLDDDCDLTIDEGDAAVICPPAANVSQTACMEGACTLVSCEMGFGDCNLDTVDGCETRLNTLTDCAICGTVCDLPNATTSCDALACELGMCDEGFADCDAATENGCETSLSTLTDCEACGRVCDDLPNATATCAEGICAVASCDEGFGNCDGLVENGCETSLLTNDNCNGCNQVCARANGGASCETGTCILNACNAGFGNCDGAEINGCETNLNTDSNCQACGVVCQRANAQASCGAGECSVQGCNPGWGNCDGADINGCEMALDTIDNCGACGRVCDFANANSSCNFGMCELSQCDGAHSNCDGLLSNGCEVAHDVGFGSCGGPVSSVGAYDGDRSCGFTCGSNTSWNLFGTRTGNTSAWFRGRVREDSTCSANIEHQIRLQVPDGVDYDLFVYRDCGSPYDSSLGLSGVDETVTVSSGDSFASDDDFDYWVEVRFYSGSSCSQWTLSFYGHDC